MEIKEVGVVGFGTMGTGIARVCAQAGYRVTVFEINQGLLDKGRKSLEAALAKDLSRGKLTQKDLENILGRIKGTTSMPDFSSADMVIEAATENLEVKKKIFSDLNKNCLPHCILATNTSCLSVTDVAIASQRPEKVIGLHFFNPVPAMALLEIIVTLMTANEVLKTCQTFAQTIGKTPVLARDTPGFIVNRLLLPFINNAIRMLEGGVASREDIDSAVKLGLNHPSGPLALADLIGLDVVLFMSNCLYDEFKEPQYAPPVILKKMVSAGWLGRKTGKGFYDYQT